MELQSRLEWIRRQMFHKAREASFLASSLRVNKEGLKMRFLIYLQQGREFSKTGEKDRTSLQRVIGCERRKKRRRSISRFQKRERGKIMEAYGASLNYPSRRRGNPEERSPSTRCERG